MPELKRVSVARNLEVDKFSGATFTDIASYVKNGMIEKHTENSEEHSYVTQRPGFDVFTDASDTVADAKGRGIYYWNTKSARYFVNDDVIYKNSYSLVIGSITSGFRKGLFLEVGSYLVFLDHENNEGWTINSSDVLAQISDLDFPTTLAGGGAVLNSYVFVMDSDGTIYHSDSSNPTAWTATNVIDAAREPDGGIYLTKHHDHIVAIGTSTIEFFYDAGNPNGSVLGRRQDISYNIGAVSEDGVWYDGDDIFFLGRKPRGDIGVYRLSKFQLAKISTNELDAFLTENITKNNISFTASGFSSRDHMFFILTAYDGAASTINPKLTLVYDSYSGTWHPWTTGISVLSGLGTYIPVMDWTISGSTSNRYGEGILSNGDLISIREDMIPQDSEAAQDYMENPTDYVAADYVETMGGGAGDNIDLVIRVGHIDFGTNRTKFIRTFSVIMDLTDSSQDLTIQWSDTDHTTFNTGKIIDTSAPNWLTQLGKTNRRTMQLSYSGGEIVRIMSMEFGIQYGNHYR